METRLPNWIAAMDEEDVHFLRRFVLASGSLKEVAQGYGISYPTVRSRLDRLIAKVEAAEDPSVSDPLRKQIQVLLAEGQLTTVAARKLLTAYRVAQQQEKEGES